MTPREYTEQALEAYSQAEDPTRGPFMNNRAALNEALQDLVDALKDGGHTFETALAEEAQITLRIIFNHEDLSASGIRGDLMQIYRRLTE